MNYHYEMIISLILYKDTYKIFFCLDSFESFFEIMKHKCPFWHINNIRGFIFFMY